MALYRVELTAGARKELTKIQKRDGDRIAAVIDTLVSDPRPPGCKKLSGSTNEWRIRQGVYRILYTIEDSVLLVTVFTVDHRSKAYKRR